MPCFHAPQKALPRRAFAKMASFTLAESPISPFESSRNGSSRDWEEFANVLLEDGFILTALELHTELLEYGKEIPTLRDYFSNPGNFEHAIPQPPSSRLLGSDISTWLRVCLPLAEPAALGSLQGPEIACSIIWYKL